MARSSGCGARLMAAFAVLLAVLAGWPAGALGRGIIAMGPHDRAMAAAAPCPGGPGPGPAASAPMATPAHAHQAEAHARPGLPAAERAAAGSPIGHDRGHDCCGSGSCHLTCHLPALLPVAPPVRLLPREEIVVSTDRPTPEPVVPEVAVPPPRVA